MNQITCNVISDLLELYADGVVSDDTKDMVEYHLSDCSKCIEKLALIKQSLNLPAEVNEEPIKKIKRKIKKKNIIVSLVSVFAVATILVAAFSFINQYKVAIPYERTHIFSVEQGPDEWDISINFMDNIEEYNIYGKLLADGTNEYYIYFSDNYISRLFSNRAAVTSFVSIPAYEKRYYEDLSRVMSQMGFEVVSPSQDGELIKVQTVRIYYCTFGGKNGRMDFSEKFLIWEK